MDARRFGYFFPKPDGSFDITVNATQAPPEVLQELEEITAVIFYLQPILLAWTIVNRNHSELLNSVEQFNMRLSNSRLENTLPMATLMDGMAEIGQRLGNYLSAATAFLSQTEVRIAHVRGSSQRDLWKSERQAAHLGSFAYRFLYALRNFNQHFGIPISTLDVHGTRKAVSEAMRVSATPRIVRDGLLAEEFNWKSVRAEIEGQSERFDLMPLCREYWEILRLLCRKAIEPETARLERCADYFDVVVRKFKIPKGATPVLVVGDHTPGVPPTTYSVLPFEQFVWVIQHYQDVRG
jgi:hypothetical protein